MKNSYSGILMLVIMSLLFGLLIGCGEQPQGHAWRYDGPLQYRFPNAYTCIIVADDHEVTIHRGQEEGRRGPIEWEWEDDGDIDIEFRGNDYDLDSPYDYDESEEFDGYEEAGGGFIFIWLGGKKLKKKRSWLKKNPKYNKVYKRTKYKVNKDGSVTKTKITTVKGKKGAVTQVKKTTINKNGTKTVKKKTTYVTKKKPVKKKKAKKRSSKKRSKK